MLWALAASNAQKPPRWGGGRVKPRILSKTYIMMRNNVEKIYSRYLFVSLNARPTCAGLVGAYRIGIAYLCSGYNEGKYL